jgi:hypothetical protein
LGIHGLTLTLSPETPRKLPPPPPPFASTCDEHPKTEASTLLHHLRATRMTVVRQRDGSPVGARHFPHSLSSHARCLYRMDDLLETGPRRYSEDSRGILHLHGALHGLLESALLPCLSLPLDFFLCFALRRQQSNKQVIYPCFSFLFFSSSTSILLPTFSAYV